VLLSGERSVRLKYRAIISDLDSPVESAGNTHVVYLRYADAGNIATILTNVAQNALKAEAKNVGASGAGGGGGGTVSVQADEESNALVISAPSSIFPSLRSVIQQLDIPRAQVHIEAIIAEVSLTTARELGVQWLLRSSKPGVVGSSQFSTFLPSIGSIVGGVADGVVDSILPDGGILGLGNIDDDGLSIVALIRALQGDGETNLLSTPSLVTLDNQEAEIIVGQNVPFVTGQSTGLASTTNNPFQSIERQDIGVSLKVKPQINEGNTITMKINQEVSDIAASSEGAVDIVTTKRAITTTVQIEDGELLVLGGLISDKLINIEQKVPFLGDLPLIGALFRSTSTEKGKQNLMVFIRATIIKDPKKARALSARKYNFLRDLQLQYSGEDQLGPALVPYDELGDTLFEFDISPSSDE
jgi:general secretion pathway protein D